jgi:hypothetical protein
VRWAICICVAVLTACGERAARPFDPAAELPSIAARVQELRGLALDPVPELVVQSRAEWVASRGPVRSSPDFDALWHALGIVPADESSAEGMRAIEQRQIGYYDTGANRITYITDTSPGLRRQQLAHALVHALQMQHGPLYKLPRDAALRGYIDDVSWAWACAREGEAILHELAWPGGGLDQARSALPSLARRLDLRGPAYAVRWSYFSYFAGSRYASSGAASSLRDACRALHEKPPMSTEQVVSGRRDDPPLAVLAPDLSEALGGDWELRLHTVLGDWTIADWLDPPRLATIGAGLPKELKWGGDLAQVYWDGEDYIVLVWTVWDDVASAIEFRKRAATRAPTVRLDKRLVVALGPFTLGRKLLLESLRNLRAVPFRSVEELARIVK